MANVNRKTGGFHYAYLVAAACCAISAASVGLTISCAGIFYDPVSKELGVGKGDFGAYVSILLFASTLTLTVAGKAMGVAVLTFFFGYLAMKSGKKFKRTGKYICN